MTFDEWVSKRKNKSIDYDGYYGVQCCDLANDYFANVHGIPSSALFIFYNAINYFTDFNKHKTILQTKFKAVKNTPSYVPKKGVVAVFKGHGNGIGHISICTGEGDTNYFYSYDQNWTGRNEGFTNVKHDYSDIAGFLEPIDRSNIDIANVSGFKAANVLSNAIKLTWNKVTNADGYIVYRYDTKAKKYKRIAKGKNLTYTDKNLASGTSYKYAIRAYKTMDGKEILSPSYPQITAVTTKHILDKSGYKSGDKTTGLLAMKELLLLAYNLKMTKYKVAKDGGFGNGTKSAVNELLGKWGYQQNGIAGTNFIKRLHTEIEKKI